jgi:flagellin
MGAAQIGSGTVVSALSVSSVAGAANSPWYIDAAIQDVDGYRATLGATANRLEHSAANLMTRSENQMAARSRIEDADYAVKRLI